MITYLHLKNSSNKMDWVSEIEAKGTMWASPGPYLRRSMLVTLARKVSDLYLPESFYSDTTFLVADGCASRVEEEEDDMVSSLTIRLQNEREASQASLQTEEEGDDSENDSEVD